MNKQKHPCAVSLRVTEEESAAKGTAWPTALPTQDFDITPELSLPKTPSIEGAALEWKVNSYAHLFWLIPREEDEAKWNCEMFHIEMTMANAVTVPGQLTVARAFRVSVPALHNTRPIRKGGQVALKWPKPKALVAPKKKSTGQTWLTDVKKQKLS